MSMLAERKIKQKWSLNPRGKQWSEDTNKFGQKMLEKMGWSKGKGLGAKEDGIKEHVSLKYKNDNKGMGYKDNSEQWTAHEDNFKALLESLTSAGVPIPQENKKSSLVEKSQSSRARVHYKKFTKGKDLSRYSEKDLANIFGKKTLEEKKKAEEDESEVRPEPAEEKQSSGNETFYKNAGSMLDYFKKKTNFGKIAEKGYVIGQNGVLQKANLDYNDEEDERPSFGFNVGRSDDEDAPRLGFGFNGFSMNGQTSDSDQKSKKKRKSMDTIEEDDESQTKIQENGDVSQSLDTSNCDEKPRKKKRKKSDCGNDNSIISENGSQISCADEGTPSKKKKKKAEIDNPAFDENSAEISKISCEFEVKRKQKKSEKNCNGNIEIDNPAFNDNNIDTSVVSCDFEVKRKQKKKKKKSENDNEVSITNNEIEIDNPAFNETIIDNSAVSNEFEVTRKSKKKKKKSENDCDTTITNGDVSMIEIDNPCFNDEVIDNSVVNNEFEVTRKKKKKRKQCEVDNPAFNELADDSVETSQISCEFEVTRKNKKSKTNESDVSHNSDYEVKREKKKKKEVAVDNPAFDETDNTGSVNPEYEVPRKKKKKNVEVEIDNLGFNDLESSKIEEEVAQSTVLDEITCDLQLNVTATPATPILKTPAKKSTNQLTKRRKSVRFSAVNQEHIIPNLDDLNEERNELFEINSRVINGNDPISQKIDGLQAEVENDLNEAKALNYVGDTSSVDDGQSNMKLPNGHTKLKFRFAQWGKTSPHWGRSNNLQKQSYKHLIKGDIEVGFKNSNLHQIEGYAVAKKAE